MAFKNNGINVADIARMERNYATEIVNSNIPACLSFSTSNPDAPYLGDFITYKTVNSGGVIEEVTSNYKSLIGIVKPSDARSNVMSAANPYDDLRSLGVDPNVLSGYRISTRGGHSLLQLNTSITMALSRPIISDTARTTVYFRVFGLDKDDLLKWTMISGNTIPAESRAAGDNFRTCLSINTGAVIEQNDKIIFGVSINDYAGDEFPTGTSFIPSRWNCNMQLFVRKYTNTKP